MTRPHQYITLAAVSIFLALTIDAAFANTAPGDGWFAQQLQSIDSGAVQHTLDATEDFATLPLLAIVGVVAAAVFIYRGGMPVATVVVLAVASRGFVSVLKELIARPRPSVEQVHIGHQPTDYSFPSGHAFNAIVMYGLIVCLAAIYIPVKPLRWAIQVACVWVIGIVSLERVYDGNHWPSDVLGGLALGTVVVCGLLWLHGEMRGGQRVARLFRRG